MPQPADVPPPGAADAALAALAGLAGADPLTTAEFPALPRGSAPLTERAARIAAERLAGRLARLQTVSAALVVAADAGDVARALTRHGARALAAQSGTVAVVESPASGPAVLRVLATAGYPPEVLAGWPVVGLDEELPFAIAARTGQPVLVGTRAEAAPYGRRVRQAMELWGEHAFAVVPLAIGGRVVGVLALGFAEPRTLAEDERSLVAALAAQGAQALERVRLADRERQQRAQLDALLDASPVGLAFFDRELRYQRLNDALAAMNQGLGVADHLGRRPHEVYPGLGVIEPVLARVLATGQPIAGQEWDALAESGRAFRASYYPVPGADGVPQGVGVVVEDVTAERQAAADREFLLDLSAALQTARATDGDDAPAGRAARLLGERLRVARCALWDLTDGGGTAVLRHAWVRPGSAAPLVDRFLAADLAPIFDAAQRGQACVVADAAADPRTAPRADWLARAGLGAFVVVPLFRAGALVAGLTISEPGPRAWAPREVALLAAAADRLWPAMETARLLAAEQRARAEAEAARQEAERASRAKSEFLAVMSHELRTPLNAIAGHAQLIALGIHGPVTGAQAEALERLRRSQQHLLTLIDDVLNFARLESGRVEYRAAVVPLADVVAEVAPMVEPLLAGAGIAFAADRPAADAPAAWADREKVRQIVLNLLSNAIKFTPTGGRVTLAAGPGPLPGTVALRVADSGRGIPADRLEDIFAPFVQVDAGLTRTSEGTGLGLAISRDLARGMGGDLAAESTPGAGSTFTLTLPRA